MTGPIPSQTRSIKARNNVMIVTLRPLLIILLVFLLRLIMVTNTTIVTANDNMPPRDSERNKAETIIIMANTNKPLPRI
ncbi:amino acid permease [Candidatus Scalindua japonica]|uniref:Amino acid permease n=1 Tax=Candidatus Scalindua japonica TaxID=1284222 RepID=A0A286U456_9BACT|nr:amino acid permease [Candidatus Scalindua japonica]